MWLVVVFQSDLNHISWEYIYMYISWYVARFASKFIHEPCNCFPGVARHAHVFVWNVCKDTWPVVNPAARSKARAIVLRENNAYTRVATIFTHIHISYKHVYNLLILSLRNAWYYEVIQLTIFKHVKLIFFDEMFNKLIANSCLSLGICHGFGKGAAVFGQLSDTNWNFNADILITPSDIRYSVNASCRIILS